jgi:hypothetical protein
MIKSFKAVLQSIGHRQPGAPHSRLHCGSGLTMLSWLLASVLLTGAAEAGPIEVNGVTGYLSEWAMNGSIQEARSGDVREFSGALEMVHVGLCSQAGPLKKTAGVEFQITKAKSRFQIQGILAMDGATCSFGGPLSSNNYTGSMDCSNAKGVPVAFSVPAGILSPSN